MTEPPKQEAEVIEPAQAITLEQLTEQVTRITEFLDKGLENKIKDIFLQGMNPIVDSLKARFEGIDAKIGGQHPQQGGGGLMDLIGKIADKVNLGAGGGGGSSFGNEIEGMVREIVKLDLKDMLYTRRRSVPALAQHVEVP